MAQPYIGEIRLVAYNFAPSDWALCDGALQSIAQNPELFSVIGTTYGGDGVTTFALPDLRSRSPIHTGTLNNNAYPVGQSAGEESVTLTPAQLPLHTHYLAAASTAGTKSSPSGNIWASSSELPYASNTPNATMSSAAVASAGGGQAHNNISPYLTINFVIALHGIYPAQG
jgi:microcystin-dependent protein